MSVASRVVLENVFRALSDARCGRNGRGGDGEGGGAEEASVGLPPKPEEGSGLCPSERTSGLDSMTEETGAQKRRSD